MLVCNVNKGTLEVKKNTLEIISPTNTASCLLQWLYGGLCGCANEQAKIIFKDVHYKSKNLAEESWYTVSLMHVRVALICSCGKR